MEEEPKPNDKEKLFLKLAYNRFYDLFEEIMSPEFLDKNKEIRFFKIKEIFSVYSELLNYIPLKEVVESYKTKRPPMESELSKELIKFFRNIITHFPFFENWDEVWINKKIINWHKENQFMDKFLKKYAGRKEIKYRFWEPNYKKMTYLSVNFPKEYEDENKIFLKNIISEKEGIKFCLILMHNILSTQVEEGVSVPEYALMACISNSY